MSDSPVKTTMTRSKLIRTGIHYSTERLQPTTRARSAITARSSRLLLRLIQVRLKILMPGSAEWTVGSH